MEHAMSLPSCASRCATLAFLALLAAPLAAQAPVVESVSPAQGTLGTELVLTGSFAEHVAPRVWLEFPASEPGGAPVKDRLRVVSYSATEIHALVMKAQVGPCQVVVKLPHLGSGSGGFEVVPPSVSGFLPATAGPGDQVVLSGAHFGARRVKVTLFDRPCKLLQWSDDALTFKVPASLPDGEWTPRVSNPLGEAVATSALVTTGSTAEVPAEYVQALVGGLPFLAAEGDVVASNLGAKLAFDAYAAPAGEQQQLSVLIPFSIVSSKVPKLFSGTGSGSEPVCWQEKLTSEAPPVTSLYVVKPATLPWKVHGVGRSQGAVFGLMSATLGKVSGPGPDTLLVENGFFLVKP